MAALTVVNDLIVDAVFTSVPVDVLVGFDIKQHEAVFF